jgi:DNA repair photolyase
MFLPQNRRPKEDWGRWLQAKRNAVELAHKRAPKLAGQALYMSSVTDPYLPAERSLFLTRGILEALVPHQPRLLIQTRGPLVVRDIDVLRQFRSVRINVSIPTDSEEVWRVFEPKAPPLEKRWQAAAELRAAGLSVGLCLTPLLPLADPDRFADRAAAFQPEVLVVQEFHDADGQFGADTRPAARRMLAASSWFTADYLKFLDRLRDRLARVYEGEEGFFPPEQNSPVSWRASEGL